MPKKATLVEMVRDALASEADVKEKRMFGGVAFMIRGKLCMSARKERIMCRVDPSLTPQLVTLEGCRAVVMRGRKMKGYVYVKSDVLSGRAKLNPWVDLSLRYNKVITASPE